MYTIRKFGLKYCDLPTMMWNVSVFLRALSLNIDKRNKKGIPIILYLVTTVITVCYTYVYFISMLWFVFVRSAETGEVLAALIVFSLGIASEIGASKFLFMHLNIRVVKDLVEKCLHCDSIVVPGSRFDRNIRKTLRVVKFRAIVFWIVIIGNGLAYGGEPLILPGRHLMEDSLILYGLEPMYESPNYEVAYFVTLAGIIFTVYNTANITAFLIVITGYTEAQLLGLSDELRSLWNDAEENYWKMHSDENIHDAMALKNRAMNDYVKKQLKEVAKTHTFNINLIQQLESVFRIAIAIEFVLLIISLIAELLGGLENTYLQVPFGLMQVAMDCLVGQRLIDASGVFEDAVYDSKWENFNIGNMKTVLLMLQNSQKTLTLSAGGVTTLSFMTLMSVLKSVYSAYTTLRSTMNIK